MELIETTILLLAGLAISLLVALLLLIRHSRRPPGLDSTVPWSPPTEPLEPPR